MIVYNVTVQVTELAEASVVQSSEMDSLREELGQALDEVEEEKGRCARHLPLAIVDVGCCLAARTDQLAVWLVPSCAFKGFRTCFQRRLSWGAIILCAPPYLCVIEIRTVLRNVCAARDC